MKFYQAIILAIVGTSIVVSQPLSAKALSSTEVGKIAEGITVLIDYKENSGNGSGVIIKKDGNTYTVLTAAHVVANPKFKYEIVGNDNQRYPLNYTTVKKLPNQLDLAVVTFTSNQNYQVAKIGNSDSSGRGTLAYVSGFPGKNAVINESILTVTEGKIAGSSNKLNNGYGLVYDITTKGGMSGGAVLNEKGELIGIHGRADSSYDEQTDTIAKSGFNLGIPINTFVRLSTQVGVNTGITLPAITATGLKAEDYFVQGINKFQKDDYKEAIADFTQAIKLNPQFKEAFYARGTLRFLLKDNVRAIDDLNQAIKLGVKNPLAYLVRGTVRKNIKDYQGAISDYNRAIKLNPNIYIYAAYSFRGDVRHELKDYQGAISDYNRAIKLNPNFDLAYRYRGQTRLQLKDYQAAINDFTQTIKINPNDAIAYSSRGIPHVYLKDYQAAINDFTKAIKINPNLAAAYAGRGVVRFSLKDYQQAIPDLEKASKLYKQQGNEQLYQEAQNFINLVRQEMK